MTGACLLRRSVGGSLWSVGGLVRSEDASRSMSSLKDSRLIELIRWNEQSLVIG